MNKIKALLPFIFSVFAAMLLEQNLLAIVNSMQTVLDPAYSLTLLTTISVVLPIFTGIMGAANLVSDKTIKNWQIALTLIISSAVQLILTQQLSIKSRSKISDELINEQQNTLDDRHYEHPALSWSRLITVTTTLAVTVATLLRTIARNKQTNVVRINQSPGKETSSIADMTLANGTPPDPQAKGNAKKEPRQSADNRRRKNGSGSKKNTDRSDANPDNRQPGAIASDDPVAKNLARSDIAQTTPLSSRSAGNPGFTNTTNVDSDKMAAKNYDLPHRVRRQPDRMTMMPGENGGYASRTDRIDGKKRLRSDNEGSTATTEVKDPKKRTRAEAQVPTTATKSKSTDTTMQEPPTQVRRLTSTTPRGR